jgi:glycerate-2-kinase
VAYIKNRDQLLAHGNAAARRVALDIVEHALAKADPYKATRALVNLENDTLSIGDLQFDLKSHPRIFLLGAGKATYPIAKALEDILGPRITDGVIVCKYGQQGRLSHSRMYLAGHPIPDQSGMKASQKALELAARTQADDLVFGCVTGGSSALYPFPAAGVTLEDKQKLTGLLLTCGANIVEINSVRKHVSQIKGGRLAKAIHCGAHLINLTVSDVIGDPLDYITDPTVPDTSTLDDARSTLTKFDLWKKVPLSVSRLLKNAGSDVESPKVADFDGYHRYDFIIVKGTAACEAAAEKATRLGFNTLILSTMLEGESKELGRTFGAIAAEILLNNRPITPPGVVIGGGETTVKIDGGTGVGGPNQEFAVSAALAVEDIGNVVVVGLDTDGTDGPTDRAGAITDDSTASRARAAGLDLFDHLREHNVTPCLQKLGDSILTGATGTNVNDLNIMVVLPGPSKSQSNR